jgi:hypothetical protein
VPYEGEFAQYRSLRRLAESQRVMELLGNFRVQRRPTGSVNLHTISLADVTPTTWFPSWVLAVDGSHAEVAVQNGYPQAEASYVTVASVLIDLDRVRVLDQHRPVDPREFRRTERATSIDCALPSCNIISDGDDSAGASLRRGLFDVFSTHSMLPDPDCESLLDTYEALLAYKPMAREQRCPYDDCPIDGFYARGLGRYSCQCSKRRPLYSTDALRIHEGMNLEGTNGAMFAEIMQVLERVWIVHFLRTLEQKKWLPLLRDIAIVIDGPLAVFGHPAWLSQAIREELSRINEGVRRLTGGLDVLLIGVEKTGHFVQHFEDLDQQEGGGSGNFPCQAAMLIDDAYIKGHIVFSESEKPYGQDTYFGRKFFYKTRSGARIVASLPCLTEDQGDTARADPDQFPRLADALGLIDQLVSSRYPNALAPLVAAHAEAAIPLNLGNQVLQRLARELIAKERA